jgi:hypothetical protein
VIAAAPDARATFCCRSLRCRPAGVHPSGGTVFGPYLFQFQPATRIVPFLAGRLSLFQSENLNFYLAVVGALLLIVPALVVTSAPRSLARAKIDTSQARSNHR